MEKVELPKYYEGTYECERCDDAHCCDCAPPVEVDFNTSGLSERNWDGETVCPWCYNQLLEEFEKKPKTEGG
jgi:hypothetical protein